MIIEEIQVDCSLGKDCREYKTKHCHSCSHNRQLNKKSYYKQKFQELNKSSES